MSRFGRLALVVFAAASVVLTLAPGAHAASARPCAASDVRAKQGQTGAGMSQPYSAIVLTNTSASSCALQGYPKLVRMATDKGAQTVAVTRGNLYNIQGKGPQTVLLKPGGRAWFAIGAETAYNSPIVTFTTLTFVINGIKKTTTIELEASHPSGKPYPIGVTAVSPGRPPAN